MKSLLRRFIYLLGAIGIVGAVVYGFLPQPVDVDTAIVSRGSMMVTVDDDGRTRIREKYIVSAPLSGRLLRIEMEPGDRAEAKTTLLATIAPSDPELLDARALAEADARKNAAEAALSQADPMLAKARVELEFAETELGRKRRLRTENAISDDLLEDAELAYRTRLEAFRSANFAQEIAAYELKQAEAALIRTRPEKEGELPNEWHFEIRSPIAGSVLRVMQESSAVVTAGMPLLELGDPSDLELEIDVLSSDAVAIRPGHRVIIEHWGGEKPLEGIVKLVEPAAFTKISALGVEEQRVWVIADIVNPPEERPTLGDGYRIEARVVTWEGNDVLQVPTSALFRDKENHWALFQVVQNVVKQSKVTIGKTNGLQAEVLDGIDEDAVVIIHPSDQVADGVQIVERK